MTPMVDHCVPTDNFRHRPGLSLRYMPAIIAAALLLLAAPLHAEFTWPEDASPDDLIYHQRVRDYGLENWLEIRDDEEPSLSEISELLRQRERLMKDAEDTSLPAELRRSRMDEAIALTNRVLDKHGDRADPVSWHLLAAEDRLYRADPRAMRRLLLYEIPGPDHELAVRLTSEALDHIEEARDKIQRRWAHVETLSEGELSWLKETGILGQLERHDRQSGNLLTRARLYRGLTLRSEEEGRSRALFEQVIAQLAPVLDDAGSLFLAERAEALLASAISARHLNRHDDALRHARAFIDLYRGMTDNSDRQRVRWALLPAALERVRAERDAGHPERAMGMLASMKASASDTLAEDVEMAWALALMEHGLLRRQDARGDGSTFLGGPRSLQVLEQTAGLSLRHLDFMYRLFSVALDGEPLHESLTPFARLLLAGAAQSRLMARKEQADETLPARVARTLELLSDETFASTRPRSSQEGERLFLLGRGLYLVGQEEEAIRVLTRMARVAAAHERTPFALEQAAILAQRRLVQAEDEDVKEARQQFIHTGQLLHDLARRGTGVEISEQMRFLMALSLEESDRLSEAATMYAEVAPDGAFALVAGQRRVHCRLRLLERARSGGKEDEAGLRALAREVLEAARESHRLARQRLDAGPLDEDVRCEAARSILLYAHVANLPEIHLPNDVLAVLVDFDARFPSCVQERREAMSERVTAWVALERWEEARQALLEKAQQHDPQAGPAMAQLLERMRAVIREAMGAGADDKVHTTAGEAAALADDLLTWRDEHPEAMSDGDTETVRVWRAWTLLQAEEVEQALAAFEASRPQVADDTPEVAALDLEVRLGRAECLVHMGRIEEALAEFTALWQRLPEHTEYWWRAYAGSLNAHLLSAGDPKAILQSIRQQRHLAPDLGGAIWTRRLENIERLAREAAGDLEPTATAP